ncbi:copper chaperone PCu(A)C [Primorskyibacter sedentarius]|uniref:copper chaperone PCu(A)C n=1 Tax=Primorskyibacter sedentarius TaxID=745311 RepID=UPI003EBE3544
MSFISRAAVLAISLAATPLLAEESQVRIDDAYARVSGPAAKSGAAFMLIENLGDSADQLIDAASDAAARVELHTHIDDGNGVMQMRHVPDGFALPAGETHALERGGDHVMLMGLTNPLEDGDVITLTLTFEKSGEVVIEVPVDLDR